MVDRSESLLKLFMYLTPLEAMLAAVVLILIPGEEYASSALLGLSRYRQILLAFFLGIVILFFCLVWYNKQRPTGRLSYSRVVVWLEEKEERARRIKWGTTLLIVVMIVSYTAFWLFFEGYHAYLVRLAPGFTFLVLCLFQILAFSIMVAESRKVLKHWLLNLFLLLISLLLLLLFLEAAFTFSEKVNHAPTQGATDQLAYMGILKRMHDTQYKYIGDGSRMPLFLWIQSIFYRSDYSYLDTFQRAKTVNILLSTFLLLILFGIAFFSGFSLHFAVVFTLFSAYGVFLYKAAYFTCENLFYFLSFVSFLCMIRMFFNSSKWLAVFTGISAGLTYLTKASVLPAILIFVGVGVLSVIVRTYVVRKKKFQNIVVNEHISLILLAIVLIAFFLTILPFGIQNNFQYGGFFKNVNSSVVMWMDSWADYNELARQYPDMRERLNLPSDIRPGFSWYVKTHTTGQMLDRLWNGILWQLQLIAKPYSQVPYLIVLLFVFLFVSGRHNKELSQILLDHWGVALFCLSYFAGYLALFGWYTAIDVGPRFVMGLYLPFSYTIFSILQRIDGLKNKVFSSVRQIDLIAFSFLFIIIIDAYITLNFHFLQHEFGF